MKSVIDSVTLEPELEEALVNATDAELCDIAGKGSSAHRDDLLQSATHCSRERDVSLLNGDIATYVHGTLCREWNGIFGAEFTSYLK